MTSLLKHQATVAHMIVLIETHTESQIISDFFPSVQPFALLYHNDPSFVEGFRVVCNRIP